MVLIKHKTYQFEVRVYVTEDGYIGEIDSEEHASQLEEDNVTIEGVTAIVPPELVQQIIDDYESNR